MKTEADYGRERKSRKGTSSSASMLMRSTSSTCTMQGGGGEGGRKEGGWGSGGGGFDVTLTTMGVYLAMSNACTKFWGHHPALHLCTRPSSVLGHTRHATCSNKYHLKKPKRNPSVDVLSCPSNSFMIVWFGRETHPCHTFASSSVNMHVHQTGSKRPRFCPFVVQPADAAR